MANTSNTPDTNPPANSAEAAPPNAPSPDAANPDAPQSDGVTPTDGLADEVGNGPQENAPTGILQDDARRLAQRPEGQVKDGKLTRDGMVAAIRDGGSVMVDGRIITREDDLPSLAELAKGDKAAEAAAREVLEKQRREIDAQLSALGAGAAKRIAK